MVQLEFTKVREVKSPSRANAGDAGLDFHIPHLTAEDILNVSINQNMWEYMRIQIISDQNKIWAELQPHARILIPSGIRVLINPRESMLMAANKSGVSTKEGLIYTAEIVDSPYTGEMHIGILNTNPYVVRIPLDSDKKLMQFIHVPIILSTPVEITLGEYEEKAKDWGTRGDKGFGAHDNK